MLKRYLLVVAVLAATGAILVTQFQVRPRLQSLIDQRNQFARERDTEKGQRLKAQQEMNDKETALATLAKSLEAAQAEQTALKSSLEREQGVAAGLRMNLEQAVAKAQADQLAARKARTELAALNENYALLKGMTTDLSAHQEAIEEELFNWIRTYGPHPPPPMDLRGKVVAIDPKWGFVVLDIGSEQDARPTWTFVVSRDGRLVGKVRITSVAGQRSIANVLPGWAVDELREGDAVIPADDYLSAALR